MPDDLLGRAGLDDAAVVEDDHALTEQHGVEHVMGDENGCAVGQHPAQDPPQQRRRCHVEGGERLVEQQQPRLGGQGPGDGDALRLATGQLVRLATGQLGSVHLAPASVRPSGGPRRRPAPAARGPNATFSTTVRLGNSSGSCASNETPRACGGTQRRAAAVEVEQRPTVELGPAAVRAQDPRQHGQQGRLAGTVRPEHRKAFGVAQMQVDVEAPGA